MASSVHTHAHLATTLESSLIGYGDLLFKVSEIRLAVTGESTRRIDESPTQKGKCLQTVLVFGGVDAVPADVLRRMGAHSCVRVPATPGGIVVVRGRTNSAARLNSIFEPCGVSP